MCSKKNKPNYCDVCDKQFLNGLLNWEYELEHDGLYCNNCYKLYLEDIVISEPISGQDGRLETAEYKLSKLLDWMTFLDQN